MCMIHREHAGALITRVLVVNGLARVGIRAVSLNEGEKKREG